MEDSIRCPVCEQAIVRDTAYFNFDVEDLDFSDMTIRKMNNGQCPNCHEHITWWATYNINIESCSKVEWFGSHYAP